MALAGRILRQHHASRWESADIAITRFEFDVARQPENEQALGRIVPIHFTHTRGYVTDIVPRSREIVRQAQRRIVFEKLLWLQVYVDVFHMSFAVGISKYSQAYYAFITGPCT